MGGSNANNIAKKIMRKLLTPEMFGLYTYKGRTENKRAFANLRISALAVEAGLLNLGVTEHELQQGIQNALRHYKDDI